MYSMYTICPISCEFQFLRAIHDFQPDEVFCLTGRKIAKCNMGKRFEYRCSFCLTNMSLREFLDKMGVEHKKTEMDYSLKRFSWSAVSASDLEYCIADVLGLYEALKISFSADGLPLTEVPMTSTGYVRKRFKYEMRKGGFLPQVHSCAPDYEVYKMIRRAFRGGNTHANRYYTGVIMDNVTSWDRSSSYPDCLVNYPYSVKPFVKQDITRIEELQDGFPYLLEIEFTDLELRDPFIGCPYLPVHKCYLYEDEDGVLFPLVGAINDNGRVISAVGISFIHFCTNIDLEIIKRQYKWTSARIIKCYRSEYGMLPKAVRNTIMGYYKEKTELKNVDGQEVYYLKAKQLLNSIYGMMATNPVRTKLVFNGTDFDVVECRKEDAEKWKTATPEEQEKMRQAFQQEELEKANKKSFVCFAWGCFCTAYARKALQDAIDLCGHKFIYCDTDSVKFVGNVDFTELNSKLQALSEKHNAFADDPAGKRHYLGVFERESTGKSKDKTLPTYKRFCTLGAKKYCFIDQDGKLNITIAGVSKSGAQEIGSIERFAKAKEETFIFKESAGMEAVYNDLGHEPVVIDGHTVEIPPNIYLHQSTYELSVTADYKKLFYMSQEDYDRIMKTM